MALNNNSFKNVTDSAGINWSRQRGNEAFSLGWLDYNNDNLLDLWISGHGYFGKTPANATGKFPALYINDGDGTFTNIFAQDWREDISSDTHGTNWIDFDNDGDRDLWVAGGGQLGEGSGQPNLFFVNEDGTLQEQAAARNLQYSLGRSRSSIWLDANNDGRLDLVNLVAIRNDGQGETAYFAQRSDGTFAEPISLNVGENSRYAQLADLTGDGKLELIVQGTSKFPLKVFELDKGNFTDITNNFNFPLTSEPVASDPTQDFFSVSSARDSVFADFDNDGDNDLFLTRSDTTVTSPSVSQSGSKIINADLLNQGKEIGLSWQTSGQIALDLIDIFEREPELEPTEIFIGGAGRNPTTDELNAIANSGSATSLTLNQANADGAGLVLDPNNIEVQGIQRDRSGRGLYIGYDPGTQTWQLRLSSPTSEIIRLLVESTEDINYLHPINFTNPDPNSKALGDQLWLFDQTTGQFVDTTTQAGLGTPTLAQSTVAGDFDNDKDLDLYLANAYPTENQPNILYENQGDGTFVTVPQAGGAAGEAVGPIHLDFNIGSRLATADYDGDGFLDIFVGSGTLKSPRKTYLGTPPQLFKNQGNDNNWLEIDLEGTTSNRDGIGAQVKVTSGGVTQLREQNGGMHVFAQNSSRLHFGLAQDSKIDVLEIKWPSGITQTLNDVAVNQILSVIEPEENSSGELREENSSSGVQNKAPTGSQKADNIIGLAGDDIINGLAGDDTIAAGTGDDLIFGGLGDDELNGGAGNDGLYGNDGNDLIRGEAGVDLLVGDNGDDTLNGGAGDDYFYEDFATEVVTGIDVLTGAAGADHFVYQQVPSDKDFITDFEPQVDIILVSASGFGGGITTGLPTIEQFVIGSAAKSSSDRFIYNSVNGQLLFDVDGTGNSPAALIATLKNQPNFARDNLEIYP